MQLDVQQQAAQRNLSYLLAEKLAQKILSGEYKAETILPGEMELSYLFNVSRTAVREAVKMLSSKGMLLARPRIGTRVMPSSNWNYLDQELLNWWMTQENFDSVMQHFLVLRSALEPQACFLAAKNANKEEKEQLKCLIDNMNALDRMFDREQWVKVDADFHQLIYKATKNPFLMSFSNLLSKVYNSYFRAVAHEGPVKLACHKKIVTAILEGNSEAASIACNELLSN